MANRELVIAFVYDTQRCTQEADDPQDAVLFFHPGWVSEQQRLALCGQLMGATYFLLATFSCPRVLSLQSGKFSIRSFGRYTMAIGTDRNIPEWALEQRADTMTSLLRLYFGDLEMLADDCEAKRNEDSTCPTLSDRLGRIFETFLPIVQYAGQILGNVPTVRLPKSASNVFLEAMQILRCCQEQTGVLGGAVLYQNKVVASQLSADLTKQLVLSDPYRIKSPGTNVTTNFHLPLGAQLLQVYVLRRELHSLRKDAEQVRHTFNQVDTAPKVISRSAKDQIPCLKRDKSKIFTVLEEEDVESELQTHRVEETSIPEANTVHIPSAATIEPLIESELEDLRPPLENGTRLVCSTPLHDLSISKVLHAQALSICSRGESGVSEQKQPADVTENGSVGDEVDSFPDVVRDAVAARCVKRVEVGKTQEASSESGGVLHAVQDFQAFLAKQVSTKPLSASLPSINTNNVPMRHTCIRYYSLGLPVPTTEQCSPKRQPQRCFYNTITDPCFPVFRHDGLPLSQSLFDQHLETHYQALDTKPVITEEMRSMKLKPGRQTKPLALAPAAARSAPDVASPGRRPTLAPASAPTPAPAPAPAIAPKAANPRTRRPLSLPLKTISNPSSESEQDHPKEQARPPRPTSLAGAGFNNTGIESEGRKRLAQQALPPVARPKSLSAGLPLTPLMAKLSHLAMDRHSTPAQDPTPGEQREPSFPNRVETPMAPLARPLPRPSISDMDDIVGDGVEEVVLLVCGIQSMTLLLLLEKTHATNPDLLTTLWETASASMERVELLLHHSLDHFPSAGASGADSYSFLCLDPAWDTVQKGGVWSGPELELVGSLHRDFRDQRSLTEICIRVHDSLVYGYQCGQTEVFYQQQQPGHTNVGLPTPADLMGTVPLKARRRLERDHGIVLL